MERTNPNRLDLDCGIAYVRLASWLDDELALRHSGNQWVFQHSACSCSISLESLENRELRNISIERTRLVVEGEPKAIDEFDRVFTLRFISAGG